MNTGRIRIDWLLCSLLSGLMLFLALSGYGMEGDISFKATFEDGLKPDFAINEVKIGDRGVMLVPGKAGKAVRVGREGDKWNTVVYYLPKESIDAQEAGQKPPVFPLQEGTLEFDFRPSGWEIGSGEECVLLHIRGDEGATLYVRYIVLEEIPYIQIAYGMLYSQYTEAGKKPRFFLTNEIIADKGKEHWYHIALAWNSRKMELSIDGVKKSGSLTKYTIPRYNGFRLELGIPYQSQKPKQIEGFTDIDNIVISSKGSDKKVLTKQHFPQVVIGRCSGEMKIDGRMDERDWQEAALIRGFMDIRRNGYSLHQPGIYLTYDNRYLYIGVKSLVYGNKALTAEARSRDSPVWKDDCIEIFLDPTPETIDYYQFVFNSKGTIFDQVCNYENQHEKHKVTWNLEGIRLGTNIAENEWVLELAIPYQGLGVKGAPEDGHWLFNICETRLGLGAHSICSLRSYHEREKFGSVFFRSDLPRVRMQDLGPIRSGMARFLMSYTGLEGKKVELLVKGKQFDETAGTFFALFSESAWLGKEVKNVFEADESKLKKNGVLDIEVISGLDRVYMGRIGYELLSRIEIETMRVVKEGRERRLRVRTSQPFIRGIGEKEKVYVRVLTEEGREVKSSNADVTAEKMDVYVGLKNVPPGKYKVSLELSGRDGTVKKADDARDLVVYTNPPPWHNNRLGIGDKVPPPWTPVNLIERESKIIVKCWNREYHFGSNGLLPEQILSGGRDYLKIPMKVLLNSRGQTVNTGNVKHRVVEKEDKSCQIQSICKTSWGKLSTLTTIDFDGFIWVTLTVKPNRKLRLDGLKLVWEMPLERSRLLHSGYRSLENTGRTPKTWHKCLNQFLGPFWVGDENGGISFAAESFKGWSNKDVNRQVELKVSDTSTCVNINLVDKPIDINTDLSYGFCLHPTPVRPRPLEYRKARLMSWQSKLRSRMRYPITLSAWNATPKYSASPEWCVTDEELRWFCHMRNNKYDSSWRTYRGLKESGVRSTWYSGYSYTGRNSPEFVWAGEDWKTGEKDKLYGNSLYGYFCDMVLVCKTEDYCDYYLWRLDKSKKEHPVIDGIYLDLMGWHGCTREDHNHGYVDEEGKRHATWQIREHRRWLLRIYSYLKEQDPNTPILLHLSGQIPKIMGYSFCDYLWTGELWIQEVQRDRSYKNLSLDTFRTEVLSQIWGPAVMWISQLNRALRYLSPDERKKRGLEPWAYRQLLGLLLTHDTSPRFAGLEGTVEIWKVMDRFGLDATDRFIPYWEPDTEIELKPRNGNLVATAYVKSDRALIVLFNNTNKDLNVSVRLDPWKLFGAGNKLVVSDSETGEKIGAGNVFSLRVGKRNFRLLTVVKG